MAISYIGVLNLVWFSIAVIIVNLALNYVPLLCEKNYLYPWVDNTLLSVVIPCGTLLLTLRCLYRNFDFQTTVRSLLLGSVFALGVHGAVQWQNSWNILGCYLCILSTFHFSEFLSIAWCNPKSVSVSSFILNHSREYWIALMASWVEFITESYFFPGIKTAEHISWLGFLLCIFGEILRKTAMFTAASNFNHLVQLEKNEDHQLVTHGIYSFCRHPSYLGWFLWSIGTQLLLLNPICTLAYTIVTWNFFRERIIMEELYLISFFKEDYVNYKKRVGTGLPFIHGLDETYAGG